MERRRGDFYFFGGSFVEFAINCCFFFRRIFIREKLLQKRGMKDGVVVFRFVILTFRLLFVLFAARGEGGGLVAGSSELYSINSIFCWRRAVLETDV